MIVRPSHGARLRRHIALLLAVTAVLSVLAGCGSDKKKTATSTTSASTGSTAPTSAPPKGSALKIAFLVDKTSPGSSASQRDIPAVAQAWADYTNSHGGVAGHTVQIDVKDTKGDPPTGQSLAADTVADKSVVGVLLADAAGESTFGKTITDGKLAILGGVGYFPTVWAALPNAFGVATTFPTVVNMQVIAAQRVGAKSAGVAACAEIDSCAQAAPVFEGAAKRVNIKYTGLIKFAQSTTSFTAECLQYVNKQTDFIQLSGGGNGAVRLYHDCVQQGFSGYFGASAGSVIPDLYDADKKIKLAGGLNGFPWWVDAAPVKQFRDVMAAGKVGPDKYGNPGATATYASLELFRKALENDKAALPANPTRADVIKAYGKVKNETLGGLLAQPTTYTADKPAQQVKCFWYYSYQDGKFNGSFTPTCDSLL